MLFLVGLAFLFCCSTVLVCIRIIHLLVRFSRTEENGLIGLINAGASKEVIQKNTNAKKFSSDLMDESNAMYVFFLVGNLQIK